MKILVENWNIWSELPHGGIFYEIDILYILYGTYVELATVVSHVLLAQITKSRQPDSSEVRSKKSGWQDYFIWSSGT